MNKKEIIIQEKLKNLRKSKFRNSFKLRRYMIEYIDKIGFKKIQEHTKDFIEEKLAPKNPKNDGKQTPTKAHPSFVAMHATATCCRSCLEKWHHIPKGRELKKEEKNYIESLIVMWIKEEYQKEKVKNEK